MFHIVSNAWIAELIHAYGIGILFAVILIECLGLPLPGEAALVTTALYAGSTHAFGIVSVSRVGIRMYDPIGADLETASSTTTTLGTSHPSWTLDVQWTAIGLLFIAVAALAAKENSRSRRKRKKSKKPRKGS